MMLELNSKPKKLVIQRHTNSKNWMTVAVMYKEDVVEKLADALATANFDKDCCLENVISTLPLKMKTWTVDEVYYHLEMAQTPAEENAPIDEQYNVRILNEYGKVILSSASHDFLIEAGRSGHITVRREIKTEDGGKAYIMETYSKNNKAYPHIREFQRFIGQHKGIKRVVRYPRDEHDGWEQVWKVHFKDGTSVTVGTHHLYLLDGKIVSQFASDVVNV